MSEKIIDINTKYVQSIEDDLLILLDAIPSIIYTHTSSGFTALRNNFLNQMEEGEEIYNKMRKMRMEVRKAPLLETVTIQNEQVRSFVKKYPEWEDIIGSTENLN